MEREHSIRAKPYILLMNYTNKFLKDTSTPLGAWVHQKTNTSFPYLQAGGVPGQLWEVQLCNWAPSRPSERAVRNIFPCCSQGAQRLRQFMRQTALCNPPHEHRGVGDFKWCFLLPLKSFTHGLKTGTGFQPASQSKRQSAIWGVNCCQLQKQRINDVFKIQGKRGKSCLWLLVPSSKIKADFLLFLKLNISISIDSLLCNTSCNLLIQCIYLIRTVTKQGPWKGRGIKYFVICRKTCNTLRTLTDCVLQGAQEGAKKSFSDSLRHFVNFKNHIKPQFVFHYRKKTPHFPVCVVF